jgi:death on curing protein
VRTEYLDLADLLVIVEAATGSEALVRDPGLLESAAVRPRTSVLGRDAYPDLHTKAAALLHSLAGNHPLVDGNKRLAWLATYVFLDLNGAPPETTQDEVFEFVLSVADGSLTEVETISQRLTAWT